MPESHSERYLKQAQDVLGRLDAGAIEALARRLAALRAGGGRLFVLGVGGGAANASHAVNDFRKICGLEAYAPTDNVAELTARVNDDGWESAYAEWLLGSRIGPKDGVLVFSVGGGDAARGISANLVRAVDCAKDAGAAVFGVVGRDGGHTARRADAAVLIPTVDPETVTPHAEAFQALVWHLLVSHPALKKNQTKWESTP